MIVPPLVSVCIITYNHERFIRECLDSVVSQETDFPFEVIVGDDLSTDGTVAIVNEFVASFPGLVRIIPHATKVGGTENMLSVHNAARGEFVAHLDGDDCMLPGKLQQQVEFLRSHPDHAMVAHDMEIIDPQSRLIGTSFSPAQTPASTNIDYLVAHGCYFAHSSKMYRRSAAQSHHRDRATVDFYFHIEQAKCGLIGFIGRPLGRYRRTSVGLSSLQSAQKEDVVRGHMDAYELALDLGVPPAVVYPAKLNFRYVNAMACIRAGKSALFELLTSVPSIEMRWATARQRVVFGMPARVIWGSSWAFDRLLRRATPVR